jgi:hypothetical protein
MSLDGEKQKTRESLGFTRVLCTAVDYLERVIGGDEEDRTPDLRIANATLSQLSYVPIHPPIL